MFFGKTLSQCLSPPRSIILGSGEFKAGGSPAIDWHPIKGEIPLVASCFRKLTSAGLMGHLAHTQTLSLPSLKNRISKGRRFGPESRTSL